MGSLFDDDAADDDLDALADAGAAADAVSEDDAGAAQEVQPRGNPELIGHEGAEKAILADFNAGRMPHALILAGPSGIGKATLAYRIARFLLSQGGEGASTGLFGEALAPENLYVAQEDPVFRRVLSGGHADLMVVERELDEKKGRLKNDISVDSVRKIAPFLRKTAAEGGWRVVIVDSAEYLNRSSQNALLKILEEPPSRTVLILTTSQPGLFLPTIRSRCRLMHLHPLGDADLSALFDRHLPRAGTEEKAALMRLAAGSIGTALRMHREGGLEIYRALLSLASQLPSVDMLAVHDFADKNVRYGAEQVYETIREIMTGWCMRLARAQARDQIIADVLPGDAAVFRAMLAAYPEGYFLGAWERLTRLFDQVEQYNLDKKQGLVAAFLTLQRADYAGINLN